MEPVMRNILVALLTTNVFFSMARADENKDVLSAKEQSIVTIAAFTANGDQNGLTKSLNEGLNAGLTVSEIKEVIVQLYAYAGFPRSLNALNTFMTVLKERKDKGTSDAPGKAASPLPSDKTKLELGTEIQTRLVGAPIQGAIYDFSPEIDRFLKEHLFGDIFARDILDFKTREIATISALASMGGAENQLRAHFRVGMHNGLTRDQLDHLVSIVQSKVGQKEGIAANTVLQDVLNPERLPATSTDKKSHDADPDESLSEQIRTVFPKGEKISNGNFKGDAWLQPLIENDSVSHTSVGNVTFEPGARTNWHYHPGGQILLVMDGTGYYQEKGKPKRTLRKGDVAQCPPDVPHWHGASPEDRFIQVAITNAQKGPTVWLTPVTDEEYKK